VGLNLAWKVEFHPIGAGMGCETPKTVNFMKFENENAHSMSLASFLPCSIDVLGLCYRTVVMSVCDVGVGLLWPNHWMDQDEMCQL